MSDAQWRYLKPAFKATSPSCVFSIAVETTTALRSDNGQRSERVFARAVACKAVRRREQWSRPTPVEFTDPYSLWNWIEQEADEHKRNYVVAGNMSEVLTLTGFLLRCSERGINFKGYNINSVYNRPNISDRDRIHIRRCLLRGAPDILDYTYLGKRYMLLSGKQYIDSPIDDIRASVVDRLPDYFDRARNLFWEADETRDEALLWSVTFSALSDWWQEHSAAPWGMTVGQLAMGVLRSHVDPKTVCTHSVEECHRLERHASYGGRASLWYVGDVRNESFHGNSKAKEVNQSDYGVLSGPITHVDVRSMHPYLLRDRTFPCRLARCFAEIPASLLAELMSMYHVISTVTIETMTPEYPVRLGELVSFPVGHFTTVLAGPELQLALDEGAITEVHNAACYFSGKPFEKAAAYLLDLRLKHRKAGNIAWEMFAKTLGNSLAGKFAQRKSNMVDLPEMAASQEWGEWIEYSATTRERRRFRAIAGMVSEYVSDSSGAGPYTSAFAYLTSYGRVLMRRLRQSLGADACIQQDTDGLWLASTEKEIQRLSCVPLGDSPGELAVKEISHNARFFSPRHYVTDKGWTLAGFHNPKVLDSGSTILDTQTLNPLVIGADSVPLSVQVANRRCSLAIEIDGSEITPDGWVMPRSLRQRA